VSRVEAPTAAHCPEESLYIRNNAYDMPSSKITMMSTGRMVTSSAELTPNIQEVASETVVNPFLFARPETTRRRSDLPCSRLESRLSTLERTGSVERDAAADAR
jgi:hypothetical protein